MCVFRLGAAEGGGADPGADSAVQGALVHGVDGGVVAATITAKNKPNFGYDAAKNVYCDMIKAGILDPTKVTRIALQNAASVAATLLTTEALVTDIKEPAPPMPMPQGGMDGMY